MREASSSHPVQQRSTATTAAISDLSCLRRTLTRPTRPPATGDIELRINWWSCPSRARSVGRQRGTARSPANNAHANGPCRRVLPGQGPFTCGGCGTRTHDDIAATTEDGRRLDLTTEIHRPGTFTPSHALKASPTAKITWEQSLPSWQRAQGKGSRLQQNRFLRPRTEPLRARTGRPR